MLICKFCGTENRPGAKFCFACGEPIPDAEVEEPAAEGEPESLLPPEVGALPPGTLLNDRYEIVGLVARQEESATYQALDRWGCAACGAAEPPEDSFCPECGAELTDPVPCLLCEWLAPPDPDEVTAETFEFGAHTFAVSPEEGPATEETPFAGGVCLTAGYRSNKGPEREVNQDSVLALTLAPLYEGLPAPALGLYVVADGLGGHDAGEVASSLVVQVLAQEVISCVFLAELSGEICLVETLMEILEDAVQAANAQVHAVAQSGGIDMGSTVVAILVRNDLAVVASVGDSRAYHWHDGALSQVTTDHSVVQRLVATGQVEPEEVATHPQRGVLYRSLGDRPTVEVDLFSLPLAPEDRLLLCCDGVWESLGEKDIEDAFLLELVPQRVCDLVTRRALDSGAADNVSTVVVGVTDF